MHSRLMIESRKALLSNQLSKRLQHHTAPLYLATRHLHDTQPKPSSHASPAKLSAEFETSRSTDLDTPHSSLADHDIMKFSDSSLERLFAEEISAIETMQKEGSKALASLQQITKDDDLIKPLPIDKVVSSSPKMAELLQNFDPESPPPPDADPYEIQCWLECASQQENVQRFERTIQDARDRKDYASLTSVQKEVVNWYPLLRDRIKQEQEKYFSNEKIAKPSAKKYMPFLCTLQAEKLAVIASHETIMHTLQKGDKPSLVGCALKIANAVEAEVNVQRLLRIRGMEEREKKKALSEEEKAQSQVELENNEREGGTATALDTSILSSNKRGGSESDIPDWMYLPSHLQSFVQELNRNDPTRTGKVRVSRANRRARQLLETCEDWTSDEKCVFGVALLQMLLDTATVTVNGERRTTEPAFSYSKTWLTEKKSLGVVTMNKHLYTMILEDKYSSLNGFTTRYRPMVIPPNDWSHIKKGGYEVLQCDFMRTHGCNVQKDALGLGDLSTIMEGLNALGRVPWKINKTILEAAERCWDEGVVLGDIPSREDFEVPPAPIRPDDMGNVENYRKYRESALKHRRMIQKNMDLNSLRCSATLKLNQARQFEPFEKIYFPYNVDFRGRAYPLPPHLSNIGSDLSRGLLNFSESKPLGPRGLYWLKVHLANLAGADKMSFDERAAFTDENLENVRACVEDPFGNNRWWMTLDDPFQGLATCNEIIAAIDSGDPESYDCALPVHMDGSCNGLQHYAALGRDKIGGKAVNLCNFDEPQDVYIGVMHEVIRRVAEEADRMLDIDLTDAEEWTKDEKNAIRDNRAAKLVNGLIDRGVVKRTVMTSVYGVTFIGAKKQIQEKIEEKLESKGHDVYEIENEIQEACSYLARVTMDVMGELFIGARQTMNWLASCARLISTQGQPVSWISPTGIPIVQPYRRTQPYTIVTLLQSVTLVNSTSNLPIHKQRQQTAFPPNYVHSLDSSHMIFTALEMDRRGLTFSAVHDSFWTHPCDVDEMNVVLRDCFVDLYNKPLLEDLKKNWELQYPTLDFPELPETGTLDLEEVRKAPYFFQ